MKIIRGLEQLSQEDKSVKAGDQRGEERAPEVLIMTFQYLKMAHKKKREKLLTKACCDSTK